MSTRDPADQPAQGFKALGTVLPSALRAIATQHFDASADAAAEKALGAGLELELRTIERRLLEQRRSKR